MRDEASTQRFEIGDGADVVFAEYRRSEGRLFINHVEAPPHLRGTGAASRLMAEIVALAEREGRTIVPVCSYAEHWLRRRRRAG